MNIENLLHKLSKTYYEQARIIAITPQERKLLQTFSRMLVYSEEIHSTSTQTIFMKVDEKTKSCSKKSKWGKYFDRNETRVSPLERKDDYNVVFSKLILGSQFARGAYSQLYQGIYRDEPVAVKIIFIRDDDENEELAARLKKQFNAEVTLLPRLQHQNIVKFVAEIREPPVLGIITEYQSQGSLRAYLRLHKSIPLPKLITMAMDIAKGMEYVHSQGIIHKDLKSDNLLIDENFQPKIADFGIACEEAYCNCVAYGSGTYRWMAPELIKHESYNRKVDVYSFGIILWELLTGAIPYDDLTPIEAASAVAEKNLRPVIPEDCPLGLRTLIERCWSLQPEKRPEFWQVVKVLQQYRNQNLQSRILDINNLQDQKASERCKLLTPVWCRPKTLRSSSKMIYRKNVSGKKKYRATR